MSKVEEEKRSKRSISGQTALSQAMTDILRRRVQDGYVSKFTDLSDGVKLNEIIA